MSAPTAAVRTAVYRRDGNRCVACNTDRELTFQHRAAVGMGGSKIRPSVPAGLTLCLYCNTRTESDMQTLALVNGWKVRRWADPLHVPVNYPHEFGWFILEGTTRRRVKAGVALDLMHATYGDDYFRLRMEAESP